MELKDYLKELNQNNNKVLGDLMRNILEMRTNQYILSFHLLKKCVEDLHNKSKGNGLTAMISLEEDGGGYYFSSEVYKADDGEVVSLTDKSIKALVKNADEILTDAVERLHAPSDSWMGKIKDDSIFLELDHPDCNLIDDWFLSSKLKATYEKSLLELELSEELKPKPKKMKL